MNTKRGWQRRVEKGALVRDDAHPRSQHQARGSDPSSSKPESHHQSQKPKIADRWPKLWVVKIWKTEEPVFSAQGGTTQRDRNQKCCSFSPIHFLGCIHCWFSKSLSWVSFWVDSQTLWSLSSIKSSAYLGISSSYPLWNPSPSSSPDRLTAQGTWNRAVFTFIPLFLVLWREGNPKAGSKVSPPYRLSMHQTQLSAAC